MVSLDETLPMMEHIAALMPFLGVNFDPSALKPIKTFPKIGSIAWVTSLMTFHMPHISATLAMAPGEPRST